MFNRVLVANRGAAAARIIRALNALGIQSVAVYSDADCDALYLAEAGRAVCIGAAPPRASYLNAEAILAAARAESVDAVHPGYGFLSENAGFAELLIRHGIAFIGPEPRWLDAMGHKTRARAMMAEAGIPVGSGSAVLPADDGEAMAAAQRIGYPVLVKPAAGGGGVGMLPAMDDAELLKALVRARSMAQRGFGNADVYLERLLVAPRHIEFQIMADNHGNVRHLFERDCSVQRRHQKVLEEAAAPGIERAELEAMADTSVRALARLGYNNIGTVEMLRSATGHYQFIEMNTRLQVEHAVTEAVTGVDIVASQIRLAAGEWIGSVLPDRVRLHGHAIEARVYAEDPVRFLPSPGPLDVFRPPRMEHVRVETGYAEGGTVTPYYDPMIAKLIAWGETRSIAIGRLREALAAFVVRGISTNIPALLALTEDPRVLAGDIHTGLLAARPA